MYGNVDFEHVRFAPGLEATQGATDGLPVYKPYSAAPEEESDQWIKVGRRGKRRSKKYIK